MSQSCLDPLASTATLDADMNIVTVADRMMAVVAEKMWCRAYFRPTLRPNLIQRLVNRPVYPLAPLPDDCGTKEASPKSINIDSQEDCNRAYGDNYHKSEQGQQIAFVGYS